MKEKVILTEEEKEMFKKYEQKHPSWHNLHVVLGDGNLDDNNIRFCIDAARKDNDMRGVRLGKILLKMSRLQRRRIYKGKYE